VNTAAMPVPLVILLLSLVLFVLALSLIVIVLAERHHRRVLPLPPLPPLGATPAHGSLKNGFETVRTSQPGGEADAIVHIIVPARDEADVIARLVRSLRALDYPAFRLTVVDDQSDDGTGAQARAAGAHVLTLHGGPPPGWTGKCYGCHQAALQADQPEVRWLLFTDADTVHCPDSLRRAVDYAERQHLDALSILLQQECVTLPEKLALPLAYQHYFAALRPDTPTLNGQYILIRRTVYFASGGFSAVRGRVMEDVALAELLTRRGDRIALLNGHDAASVRMYRRFGALLEGMTKTTFTAARDRGWVGVVLALPFVLGVWLVPVALAGLLTNTPLVAVAALLTVAVIGAGLWHWLIRFGVASAWWYAALNPFGVAILWAVGLLATARAAFRLGVRWKGRVIRTSQ
jgi:cellulose synthase/poly-beta-1,6-N-acetylglucosamine synthase-like glycosyltransferase